MKRGERRRLPGSAAVLRWIEADARDVARVDRAETGPAVLVQTVARGVRRWQRRLERRRLVGATRRSALVGISAACVLQIAALATGNSGAGLWLVPAALLAAIAGAIGLAHRTSPATAARLLDRDLGLGAEVTTALELETSSRRAAEPRSLGALALKDGLAAVASSLAGARARLRPRRGETALLAALAAGLVVLLAVPSPRGESGARAALSAKAHAAPPSRRALRAENGLPPTVDPGPSLQGFKQTPVDSPPLAAVQAGGTTRTGAAASGHSPYGGGIANNSTPESAGPGSRTQGQSGSVQGTQDVGASSPSAGAGSGSLSKGGAGATNPNSTKGGSASKGGAGATSVAPLPRGQPSASASGGSSSGTASRNGGQSQGGSGSSAPGSSPGAPSGKSRPGGATAGNTGGGKSNGKGVVPQLGSSRGALPIAPGYESVPGAKGATNESASSSQGHGGGTGHSGQVVGGAASSGGGTGVPYVPPGGGPVASIDRGVVLGYFGSFARVNASGW
ncbi:MAG TPA: hypothetical protein VFD90_15685 [Gaiellales bacterium]|nr:hypothetical protein [Gaiellales bacterium]